MKVTGKTVVVTGGANGLGGGVVDLLISKGANVIVIFFSFLFFFLIDIFFSSKILDLKEEEANEKVQALGQKCFFPGSVDITNEESVMKVLDEGMKRFGAIHAVVNCAGVGIAAKVFFS